MKRVLPYDQIGGVKFGMSMGERQIIAEARPASIPDLRVFWAARRLTLKLPGSNVGDFGLALARALRETKVYDEALSIASEIAEQDNEESRRARARKESDTLAFIQVMQTEKAEEVQKRAWALIEAADESNPDLMLLITGYLMTQEFETLKAIELENPRWIEDDEVRPERDRRYHRALDLALYPSLFHPLRATEAAEGLWQAAQVYRHTQDVERETGALKDLVALYVDSPRSEEARQRLVPLLASLETGAAEAKPEEKPKEDKPPPGPPPPPKRYNLFED
ncbi:MAG: hypothetical protein ABL994_07750 [Verrucomicrobiales bacterium]